jgi:hypothetical protein
MSTGMNTDRARGKSKGRGTEDTIIKSTVEEEPQEQNSSSSEESSAGGRPSTIENPHRTTLTLEQRHIDDLRRIRAAIMGTGGEEISRSAAVRAIFDAIGSADLDYSEVQTKEDLQSFIRRKLEQ